MHLFKSELLHEPPRPAARSYARPAYGPRYSRRSPASPTPPPDERLASPPPAAPDAWPVFDRAA
ncbi:MAG TPA: hypothetical protein VLM17_04775 [Xanthomonadaceae bacterium]|nr:hypothetical protein [Xanthomonadaceae bacterium]